MAEILDACHRQMVESVQQQIRQEALCRFLDALGSAAALAERDAARTWARWLRRNGSWPVVGRVLYRLTEFDALDWAAAEE